MATAGAANTSMDGHEQVPFTAMVLVGGLGTRLRGVVADRPKPLALVGDEPFLVHLLDQLAAAGCQRVILCTGHLGDQVAAAFGSEHAGMPLCYSHESQPLGTGGALRAALPFLPEQSVLVCNGDSYVDCDLGGFVGWAGSAGQPALVTVRVPDASRFGRVGIGTDGRVLEFRSDPAAGPGRINAGIYWLPRAVIAQLPEQQPASLERDLLPRLIDTGLFAYQVEGDFLDIGVPADYARASAFFAALPTRRARPRHGLLVVDRDGTLIADRHYLADPAGVELLPGVVAGLRQFVAQGYDVAVVTNQSGIGRGFFDHAAMVAVHAELTRQLATHGIHLAGIWHCPHHPDAGCACRKPEPRLLQQAMHRLGYGAAQCLVVGDKRCDIELGARLGVRTALVRTGYGADTERDGGCCPDRVVDSFAELAAQELTA
jgi:histidinol-phosphate phosphatase family protein